MYRWCYNQKEKTERRNKKETVIVGWGDDVEAVGWTGGFYFFAFLDVEAGFLEVGDFRLSPALAYD